MRANSAASLVVDDPLKVPECFWERRLTLSKIELREITNHLPDGDLRRKLELALAAADWEIAGTAVRRELELGRPVEGARLAKASHVRVR
jgi:hypothetical protein